MSGKGQKADVAPAPSRVRYIRESIFLGLFYAILLDREARHEIREAPRRWAFGHDLAASVICKARFFRMPGFWLDRRGPSGTRLKRGVMAPYSGASP